MSKFGSYIDETKDELFNKVSWPTWAELQESAIIVLVASAIIALIVGVIDYGFNIGIKYVYEFISGL
jgi:preprotein translocase subunit SecE